MRTDISEPVAEICRRLGLPPNYVACLVIEPDTVEAEVFRGKDETRLFNGPKFVDPKTGEAAGATLSFRVTT